MKPPWMVAPFLAYAGYSALRHDLRFDHVAVLLIVATLAFVGPRTKDLLVALYPLALVFVVYDAMRPFQHVGLSESSVHVCDLRALDARLFGSGGSTAHDWFQTHHTLALDSFCAIPYATFILWCAVGALYLRVHDRSALMRFMWGFFAMNVAGFVTYHIVPAAPPWYFHSHGCVVDLATVGSEGPALARVDAFLGVGYFHAMYAKSASVFGALPSLHCAYPLLLVLAGWRSFGTGLRIFSIAYWFAMIFSAVYLDHHWVVDALLGSAYAVVTYFGISWLFDRFQRRPALAPVEALP